MEESRILKKKKEVLYSGSINEKFKKQRERVDFRKLQICIGK